MSISSRINRRRFIQFLGGAMGGAMLRVGNAAGHAPQSGKITGIQPTSVDELVLADGLRYTRLVTWGDSINARGDKFGFNDDYIALFPIADDPDDCYLWVNHESITSGYFATPDDPDKKSRQDVELEMKEVGGSILRVRNTSGGWWVAHDDNINRRIDAATPIPLVCERPIAGSAVAMGTLGNCAGGMTPWKTFLSCEENYSSFVGEIDFTAPERSYASASAAGWERFFDMPPEHYGWVVEVNPRTGAAQKHIAMGRFAHESATVTQAADGRCVVYMGDDKAGECIYKFIADKPGSLATGVLYVADTVAGRWLSLARDEDKRLAAAFADQTELLVRTREAARIVGGTPQDRPEDIAVEPVTAAVYITLTKNTMMGNHAGSIIRIVEQGNDPLALEFVAATFLTGGEETGFACPDNLAFDPRGNLWFASDISGRQLNKPPYTAFGNNGLFFVPRRGPQAGAVLQLASAPVHAELTGLQFNASGDTLFLSVQHPGEASADIEHLESHWPEGGAALPRCAVVTLQGEFLNENSVV